MADGWDFDDDGMDDLGDTGDIGEDWTLISREDLDADLEESAVEVDGSGGAAAAPAGKDDLHRILQDGAAASGAAFNADAFFAAPRALHGIAAEMQGVLAEVETLQFEAAQLAAAIAHGPLKPPGREVLWQGHVAEDVFGPSVKPPAPPQLELCLPSEATSFAEYEKRLAGLPQTQFVARPLRLCVSDVDQYQDEKDISRDALVVNGVAVPGARGGYAAAIAAITSALCSGEEAPWPMGSEQRAAQLLLSVLNRTSSGFAAFEEVLRTFDCQDVVIVSPESAAARPLEAAVIRGVALGRAHTRYAVRSHTGDGKPIAVVDAEFCFRVATSELRALSSGGDGAGGKEWPAKDIGASVLLRRS